MVSTITEGDGALNVDPRRSSGVHGLYTGTSSVGYESTVVWMSSVALAWLLASAALLPALGRLLRPGLPTPSDSPAGRPDLRLVPDLVG
jgi:hypothetical protein